MTTDAADVSATTPAFNLRTLPAGFDLAQLMRDAVVQGHLGSAPYWRVFNGEHFPSLTVGLKRDRGALVWDDGRNPLIPSDGTGETEADYFMGGRDHGCLPAGSELPAERVLEAVAEYVRTGERPTCVEWVPEPPPAPIDPLTYGTVDVGELWDGYLETLRDRARSDAGRAWRFCRADGGTEELLVGVSGDRGALVWAPTNAVPADGLNTEPVTYRMSGILPIDLPPGAELPLDRVLDLVDEYVRTGKPTGVQWREAAQ